MAVNINAPEEYLERVASGQGGPRGGIGGMVQNTVRSAAQKKLETSPGYQSRQYAEQAGKMLPGLYAPAYAAINQQFAPQFANMRAYLASNPYAARSGVSNRLNRSLQQAAFGQLANSFGQTTADVSRGGLDLLGNLIKRRAEARYQEEADKRAEKAKGGGFWDTVGGIAGGVAGAVL